MRTFLALKILFLSNYSDAVRLLLIGDSVDRCITALSLYIYVYLSLSLSYFIYQITLTLTLISTLLPLIGDSVDRYITEDWCWSIGIQADGGGGKAWDAQWGDQNIRYAKAKKFKIPAYICGSYLTNDTVAYLHTFGSSGKGPYYSGYQNTYQDGYIDTAPRINYAMELYYRSYPPPDRIIYHSAQWDIKLFNTNATKYSAKFNESTSAFESNLNERLDQIITLAKRLSNGTHTRVGLRTAAFNPTSTLKSLKIG
jgi:hypothetical protein